MLYDLTMPSLTAKRIKGKIYYYLRECQRVDGKPKIVWQQYLGSAQQLVQRMVPPQPQSALIRDYGAVVAPLGIAQQLDLVSIIDRHVPKRGQGPSVGQYLLVACLNRCVAPRSKAQIAEWHAKTVLPARLGLKASQLTSQRFWDNMDRLDADAIAHIEQEIAAGAVARFGLDLRCLLFDATNFFTFVDSFNPRATLPQRGHSKEGRDNLRLLGLALLVSADGDVPLLHHPYAGNQSDSVTFATLTDQLTQRCRQLSQQVTDITLVFDKGNNSRANLAALEQSTLHFVGSLVPTQHPDLLAIPRRRFHALHPQRLPGVWAYRTTQKIFGVTRTVVVTYNEKLFQAQLQTLQREITKRRQALAELTASLQRHHRQPSPGLKPTLEGTQNRVATWLTARHMKQLFSVQVQAGPGGLPQLDWSFNSKAWRQLQQTLLGKTLLFTDRADWNDQQIVEAYRSQFHVEAAFRRLKDPHWLTFRPTFHWTDQKLRVHAFYCVLALMILSLMRRQLARAGISLSVARMMDRLADIRQVVTLYPTSKGQRPRSHTLLTDCDAEQKAILEALQLSSSLIP
jgi:transposase